MEERRLLIGGPWDLTEHDGGYLGCTIRAPGAPQGEQGWTTLTYKYGGRVEHDGMLTHLYVFQS